MTPWRTYWVQSPCLPSQMTHVINLRKFLFVQRSERERGMVQEIIVAAFVQSALLYFCESFFSLIQPFKLFSIREMFSLFWAVVMLLSSASFDEGSLSSGTPFANLWVLFSCLALSAHVFVLFVNGLKNPERSIASNWSSEPNDQWGKKKKSLRTLFLCFLQSTPGKSYRSPLTAAVVCFWPPHVSRDKPSARSFWSLCR